MDRTHAAFFESNHDPYTDVQTTQNNLSIKAVDTYAVRGNQTTPGTFKTSPTLQANFEAGIQNDAVFKSLVVPLPDTFYNPQDAVHRDGHPAASNGGHSRKNIPMVEARIVGATGTRATQVFQPNYNLLAVSHPMAGGSLPPRINLKQVGMQGDIPYFPMSIPEKVPGEQVSVTPKTNKRFRDNKLRGNLTDRRPSNRQITKGI